MGHFWIILQRFKSGNQMLPSMQILDGEKNKPWETFTVLLKSVCYVFASFKFVKFIYTADCINFQINENYTQQEILIASYKHSKVEYFYSQLKMQ